MDQKMCAKCGHQWWPRDPSKQPQVCPACKCRKWWEPKGGLGKMRNVKKTVEVDDVAIGRCEISLGVYATKGEAFDAYCVAAAKCHGEYSNLGVVCL